MEQELRVNEGGIRLDRFVARELPGYTREHVKGLIERGCVAVDGERRSADYRLAGGESITVRVPDGGWAEEPLSDRILFEDGWMLALDKPAGLIVHPVGTSWLKRPEAALAREPNLAGLLLRQRPAIDASGVPRCGIVHRLDRETSGVMIVAKTPEAYETLVSAFGEREVSKVYRAIVWGRVDRDVEVQAPIGRGPTGGRMQVSPYGRNSSTEFSVLEARPRVSLVEARPLTGRTHQIRAHLAHIGHPVLGDSEWASGIAREMERFRIPAPPRLMLHAYSLTLAHPRTGKKVRLSAPPPKDFKQYWTAASAAKEAR
ncbi:MAG: RluA family pseudouridine synthase [Elusimicrobia bacterium]|nr:RluA family pseudouridine synthase [Elusimicrobiota bacterium]